jgi:2-dehydro-3-deoxyphosphooctonate aldolase (KDO 8-P synthase)
MGALANPVVAIGTGRGIIPALIGNHLPLAVIAGPCQIESLDHAIGSAMRLKTICRMYGVPLVYKSSFDKANRTSGKTARGVGMFAGCDILAQVRDHVGVPVITDVHESDQCGYVAQFVDALQIPAFLCRQTDLIDAAARTGLPLNIKKGQFLAPGDMRHVLAKAIEAGNPHVMACDRGTSFGYHTLVSDMRGLAIMREQGAPVIFDATHSVQQPGGNGDSSGGQREFVPLLARAAVAVGVAGVFLECHADPDRAPSDGPNMLTFEQFERLLPTLIKLDHIAKAVL